MENVRFTLAEPIKSAGACIHYGALPTVDADPVFLEQLLQNLIANAIQYGRKGEQPRIEIVGSDTPDGWEIVVTDNGQGISKEHQLAVFEPLKRLHGSDIPGTGLGLALCHSIVSRHGGRIWLESEGMNKGTAVHFTLERAATPDSLGVPFLINRMNS
jgi:signal transduction histidine kinase